MSQSFQQVIVMGRLGQDPVIRYTQNQKAIAELSVATSKTITNKQTGEKTEKTEWHRCKAFGRTAEVVGQYLKKGSQVHLTGELETHKWQDKQTGQDRFSTEININNLTMLGSSQSAQQGQRQPAQQGYQNQQAPQGQQPAPNGFNGQQPMNNGQAPQQPQHPPQHQQMPQGGFNQNGGFGQ